MDSRWREILREHRYDSSKTECSCGLKWNFDGDELGAYQQYIDHIGDIYGNLPNTRGEPRRLNTHDVFLSVYEDIKQRNELGWAQHSKPLNVDDKSLLKWLEDAYEETLDKTVYLKGAILRLKGDSNV